MSDVEKASAQPPAEGRLPVPPGSIPFEPAPRRHGFLYRFLSARSCLALLILAVAVALVILIPYWLWQSAPSIDLKLAIVDKTVPFKDCREHRGLFWLLQQNKICDLSRAGSSSAGDRGGEQAQFYRWDRDYIGFHPETPLERSRRDTLSWNMLKDRDALIITDTYGVYTDDYRQFPNQNAAATRLSPKIYGGLDGEETAAIEQFAAQKKLIVAEFNTFATPTDPASRARLEQIFGVRWTGWCGRYFIDFTDLKDVPQWMLETYERKNLKKWNITGSGYALYHDHSDDIIFLFDDADVRDEGVKFIPRLPYEQQEVMQGVRANKCNYWFDVLEAAPEAMILADYQMALTESGLKKMADNGLPTTFPAVTLKSPQGGYRAYYIAGDVVDFNEPMGPPYSRLTLYINRSYFAHPAPGGAGCFFWHSYYPLLTNILRLESKQLHGLPEQPYIFN